MKALIIIMLFVSVAFAGDLKSIDDTWEIVDIPDGCLKWDEDLQEWECLSIAELDIKEIIKALEMAVTLIEPTFQYKNIDLKLWEPIDLIKETHRFKVSEDDPDLQTIKSLIQKLKGAEK